MHSITYGQSFQSPFDSIMTADTVPLVNRVFKRKLFAFNLSIKFHSFKKIHQVNRAYFAQQILRCYDH